MNEWTVEEQNTGEVWHFDSRTAAEDAIDEFGDVKELELVPPKKASDGGAESVEPEVVEDTPQDVAATAEPSTDGLDKLGESLETDPLSILPSHMIDTIQGKPAINKRGYAMIAERYGVSVESHIEEYPWENDDNRCVARGVAVTEDGKEYQDYATASADDGDMEDQIIELASTRPLKRCVGWASGLGIVSYVELSDKLD